MDHRTIRQSAAKTAISDFIHAAALSARRVDPNRAGSIAKSRAAQVLGSETTPSRIRLWATHYIAAMLALWNVPDFDLDAVEWAAVHSLNDSERKALIRRTV